MQTGVPQYTVLGKGQAGQGQWLKFQSKAQADKFLSDPTWVIQTPDSLVAKLGESKVVELASRLNGKPPKRGSIKVQYLACLLFQELLNTALDPADIVKPEDEVKIHEKVVRFNNMQDMSGPGFAALGAGFRTVYTIEEGRRVALMDVATFEVAHVFKQNWDLVKKELFHYRETVLLRALQRHVTLNGTDRRIRQYVEDVLKSWSGLLEPRQPLPQAPGEEKKQAKREVEYEVLKAKGKVLEVLPRQAQLLYTSLLAAFQRAGKALSLAEAEQIVIGLKEELKTKQDPWRVFKFYQAKLISLDLLRIRG